MASTGQAAGRLLLIAGLVGSVVALHASVGDAGKDVQVTAYDLRFEPAILEAPGATEISVLLVNAGRQPHNIAFYEEEGGKPLGPGAVGPVILDGESATVTFMTPAAGEYFFVCSVHPLDMKGVLRVGGGSSGASQVESSPGHAAPSPGQVGPSPRRETASGPPALVLAEHPRIDPMAFRITTFADGLPFTTAIQQLDDGSMLVALNEPQNGGFLRSTGKLVRMADDDDDGVADRLEPVGIVGPLRGGHLRVYRDIPGAIVQMRRHGDLLFMTSRRQVRSSISILRAPASVDGPFELLDALDFAFPEEHLHDTYSLALREEPDGLIGLYFNVGSRLEGMSDPAQIEVTGLVSAQLQAESVYRLTLRDDGLTVLPGELELVATGLRNAAGMAFHPRTGDLYLQDNGMSRVDDPDESLSADELNVIPVERLDGDITDFGWSDAWTAYRTGEVVGSRGELPRITFQPIDGSESEGPAEIVFAPPGFPEGLNDGLFVGFHGVYSAAGVENEENPLAYVDVDAGTYFHFVPNDLEGVGHLDYLFATHDSLFAADLNRGGALGTMRPDGVIYQITAMPPS